MRFFARCNIHTPKRHKINANIAGGLALPQHRQSGDPEGLLNFSGASSPYLCSRKPFKVKENEREFLSGVGYFGEKMFCISDGGFWYDGVRKFDVDGGVKQLCRFNGKILIFPDMKFYDPERDLGGNLGSHTGVISYTIMRRSSGGESLGLCCIGTSDIRFADYFKVGDGISITYDKDLSISGFHTIVSMDTEHNYLYFAPMEFGDGEPMHITGTLSRGAPEVCRSACISSGRVWIAGDDRISASSINDELNWAVAGDGDMSSFVCNFENRERISAACDYEGFPLFFSEKKIYKIYGDRATNFSLKCISAWGGIRENMRHTLASVRDRLYYISDGGITVFDGVSPRVLDAPFDTSSVRSAYGRGGDRYYYICVYFEGESGGRLYVYDTVSDSWQDYGDYGILGFAATEDCVCGSTGQSLVLLEGHSPEPDGFSPEEARASSASYTLCTDGARPTHICADYTLGEGAVYNFYISYDGGARVHLGTLEEGDVYREFLLIPRPCKRLSVYILGSGELTVREICALVSPL